MSIDITPTTILAPFEAEHQAVNLTRNNKGSRWDRIGNNELIEANEWRYVYDPLTGVPKLRAIMGQWTNEIQDPLDISSTEWTTSNEIDITTGQESLLAGRDSVLIDKNTSDSGRSYYQNTGVLTGDKETFHLLLEGGTSNQSEIGIRDTTAGDWLIRILLDWNDEDITIVSGSGDTSLTTISENGPNGGKVFLLSTSQSGTSGNNRRLIVYPTGLGTETGTIYHYYAGYFEASSPPPTPVYGETAGQSYTQDPDIPVVTDLDAINYNDAEGTFVVEGIEPANNDDSQCFFSINDGTVNNQIGLFKRSSNDIAVVYRKDGSLDSISNFDPMPNQEIKVAVSYKVGGDIKLYINGVLAGSQSHNHPNNLSQINIGHAPNGQYLDSFMAVLENYPRELTQSQAIQETTI